MMWLGIKIKRMKIDASLWILSNLLLFGCATSNVRTDYNDTTDFSKYKSYSINELNQGVLTGKAKAYDNTIHRTLLKQAIIDKMNTLYGLDEVAPELQVNYQINIEDSLKNNITHGTLIILIKDIKKNQIIWSGSITGELNTENANTAKKPIAKVVEYLFNYFPYQKEPVLYTW